MILKWSVIFSNVLLITARNLPRHITSDIVDGSDNAGYVSAVYFMNTDIYARNFTPQDLPVEKLTHVYYGFANLNPDTGQVYLSDPYADIEKHYSTDSLNQSGTNVYGSIKQLYLLKQKNPTLKVLLSIGGWSYSVNFAKPLRSIAGRKQFASSAIQLIRDLGFDGLDIDWEYPEDDNQADDMVALLQETRSSLNEYSTAQGQDYHYLLTVASPSGPSKYAVLKLVQMDHYVDFWNVMTYDFSGSWDWIAGHDANIYPSTAKACSTPSNADQAISHYITSGINPSKVIMGIPLYGRSFTNTAGPGSSFQGVGRGSWENGVWDYKALPRVGAAEYILEQPVASYSYDENTKTMISYDTPEIARLKARYIKARGLGGAMWWESSGDKTGNASLIGTVVAELGGIDVLDRRRNQLQYSDSGYTNLRNGFPNVKNLRTDKRQAS